MSNNNNAPLLHYFHLLWICCGYFSFHLIGKISCNTKTSPQQIETQTPLRRFVVQLAVDTQQIEVMEA